MARREIAEIRSSMVKVLSGLLTRKTLLSNAHRMLFFCAYWLCARRAFL